MRVMAVEIDKLATIVLMLIGLGVYALAAQYEGIAFFSSKRQSQTSSSECKLLHNAVRSMRAENGDDIDKGRDKLRNLARNCKAETIQELKTANYLIVWGISKEKGTPRIPNPHWSEYAKVFIARYPDWKQQHPESVIRSAASNFGFK